MRRLLPLVLLAAFTPWTFAQHSVASSAHSFAPPRSAGSPAGLSVMRSLPPADFAALRQMRGAHHQSSILPFGLGSFLSDYSLPAESAHTPPQPSINFMEALSAMSKGEEPPPPPSQPLLIELQGDRYVRVPNGEMSDGLRDLQTQDSQDRSIASNTSRRAAAGNSAVPGNQSPKSPALKSQNAKSPLTRELPPAVLIFRDGHSEDVRDYSIVAGVIYARGDYYTDGYWNKKIELTALNLPETFKSNESRGVRFVLPTAPNEVVTRP